MNITARCFTFPPIKTKRLYLISAENANGANNVDEYFTVIFLPTLVKASISQASNSLKIYYQ